MIATKWKISSRNWKYAQYDKQTNNREFKILLLQTLFGTGKTLISKHIQKTPLKMVMVGRKILTKSYFYKLTIFKTILYDQINQTSFSVELNPKYI